jgi:hypothetical protein
VGPAVADDYYVQVTSQKSEAEALAAYKSLQSKFPNELRNRQPRIHRVDLAQGSFFRAMVGPFTSSQEADALCSNMMAAGGHCLVQSDNAALENARKAVTAKPKAETLHEQIKRVYARQLSCAANRTLAIEMTKAQVYAMCGRPQETSTVQTAHGTSEHLYYFKNLSVYLTNGIVTAIQY